jgi:hypothetical protein
VLPYENDYVMIAAGLPYSFSRLIHNLNLFQSEAIKNKNIAFEVNSISKTICNNDVP